MTHILALDFDQTIAPTFAAIVAPWDNFMATWLVTHGLFKTEDEARASFQNENAYGCGPTYFAKKFGRDTPWVDAFYQAVTPLLLKPALAALQPDAELRTLLLAVQARGYTLAIISQGHRDYLFPLLKHLQLDDLFAPHLVVDRAQKRFSPNGYLQLKHLTASLMPESYIMADDVAENLATAKSCGYHTIHINPKGKALKQIDAQFPTLHAYLKTLL